MSQVPGPQQADLGLGLKLCREIGKGVHWLCACQPVSYQTTIIHAYVSSYLIVGSERTLLVDTGHPMYWASVVERLLKTLDGRALDYVFPTHCELPHAGNLPRLMKLFPRCQIVGDVRDLHLYFPELSANFASRTVGDTLPLGGRTFTFQEAVIRDLPTTLWGFDDKAGILFVSDGLGFFHYHGVGDCGRLAEEFDEISTEQLYLQNDAALYWMRYTNLEPIVSRVDKLVRDLDVRIIAAAHGSVVGDARATLPLLIDKLLEGQAPNRQQNSAA